MKILLYFYFAWYFAILRTFHWLSLIIWELLIYYLSLYYILPVYTLMIFGILACYYSAVCHKAWGFKPHPECFVESSFSDILPTHLELNSSIPNGNPFETNSCSCGASFQNLPTPCFSFHHFLNKLPEAYVQPYVSHVMFFFQAMWYMISNIKKKNISWNGSYMSKHLKIMNPFFFFFSLPIIELS